MKGEGGRAHLALVPQVEVGRDTDRELAPRIRFCSHCGARPDDGVQELLETGHSSRVCESCGFGLLLESSADAAPKEGGAFLVVDSSLSICAVSNEAERVLATSEPEAVNRHVTELVVPADAEAQGPANLAVGITWAARGDSAERRVNLRPTNVFGVRLNARIASCGPPLAALILFDEPGA